MNIERAQNGYVVSYYDEEHNKLIKQVVTENDTDNPTRG